MLTSIPAPPGVYSRAGRWFQLILIPFYSPYRIISYPLQQYNNRTTDTGWTITFPHPKTSDRSRPNVILISPDASTYVAFEGQGEGYMDRTRIAESPEWNILLKPKQKKKRNLDMHYSCCKLCEKDGCVMPASPACCCRSYDYEDVCSPR